MTKKTKEAIKATAAIIIVLLAVYLLWIFPLHQAGKIVAAESRSEPWSWNDKILSAADTISFVTEDNITLSGYRIRPDTVKGTAVLLHGLTAEADRFLGTAEQLADSGFSVYAYNQRGFAGDSIGYLSGGLFEADDVQSFTSRLYLENELVSPVVLIGLDQGGAAALQTLPRIDRIDFVIAINPLISGYEWITRRKEQEDMILPRIYYALAWWWMKQKSGYEIDPDEVGLAALIPDLADKYDDKIELLFTSAGGVPENYREDVTDQDTLPVMDVAGEEEALQKAVELASQRLRAVSDTPLETP